MGGSDPWGFSVALRWRWSRRSSSCPPEPPPRRRTHPRRPHASGHHASAAADPAPAAVVGPAAGGPPLLGRRAAVVPDHPGRARRPRQHRRLLRARLARPGVVPRHADPLGARPRERGDHVQPPGPLGSGRAARPGSRRLPPAALQPADAPDRAVRRRGLGAAAGRPGELDPLPQPRRGDAGPRARAQPRASGTRTAWSAARAAAECRSVGAAARGVRRQLGRHGPLAGVVLGAGAGPAGLGRADRRRQASPATFRLADVEHPGARCRRCGSGSAARTYWVEYQPEHSSTQVGRSIPGVTVRRQVGRGPVEMMDASPGNPPASPTPTPTSQRGPAGR